MTPAAAATTEDGKLIPVPVAFIDAVNEAKLQYQEQYKCAPDTLSLPGSLIHRFRLIAGDRIQDLRVEQWMVLNSAEVSRKEKRGYIPVQWGYK